MAENHYFGTKTQFSWSKTILFQNDVNEHVENDLSLKLLMIKTTCLKFHTLVNEMYELINYCRKQIEISENMNDTNNYF